MSFSNMGGRKIENITMNKQNDTDIGETSEELAGTLCSYLQMR